jgi:hypothetical protein
MLEDLVPDSGGVLHGDRNCEKFVKTENYYSSSTNVLVLESASQACAVCGPHPDTVIDKLTGFYKLYRELNKVATVLKERENIAAAGAAWGPWPAVEAAYLAAQRVMRESRGEDDPWQAAVAATAARDLLASAINTANENRGSDGIALTRALNIIYQPRVRDSFRTEADAIVPGLADAVLLVLEAGADVGASLPWIENTVGVSSDRFATALSQLVHRLNTEPSGPLTWIAVKGAPLPSESVLRLLAYKYGCSSTLDWSPFGNGVSMLAVPKSVADAAISLTNDSTVYLGPVGIGEDSWFALRVTQGVSYISSSGLEKNLVKARRRLRLTTPGAAVGWRDPAARGARTDDDLDEAF